MALSDIKTKHYRNTEKLLNDFRNKKIGYTEFIDQEWEFFEESIKQSLQETATIPRKHPKEQDKTWNDAIDEIEDRKKKFLNS